MADNNIEDLKAPLLAAVGAADLALATVNEILLNLRERAELAGDRVEDRRAALTRLQERLPRSADDIRDRLSTDELRRAAEEFFDDATETYNNLVERGEAALERIKGQPELREAADRVEGYVDQAVELTQEALGSVSAQTRAVGERAAKLVGVDGCRAANQSVGWCLLDQLVNRSTQPLGSNREATVLGEALRVAERGDVLARSLAAKLSALGYRLRSRRIKQLGTALTYLS